MIPDVDEEPETPREVRDATGLVVGSPAWLELQRALERSRTAGVSREGMWRIAAGVTIMAISLLTSLSIASADERMAIRPSPLGWVAIGVVPLLLGLVLIQRGRAMKSGGSRGGLMAPPVAPSDGTKPPTSPSGRS
jgi:hypothetical protein